MSDIQTRDKLQDHYDRNQPDVDPEQGWTRLQGRLAEKTPRRRRPPARRHRRTVLAAAGVGVLVVAIALVTAGALGLLGGRDRIASVDMTVTTVDEIIVDTTSPEWAARSKASARVAHKFGEAVIRYLGGKQDLASIQDLVSPEAREDLIQMLSLLAEPTACQVARTAGSDSSNVVEVLLQFADTSSEQSDFTLIVVVDVDKATITAIE